MDTRVVMLINILLTPLHDDVNFVNDDDVNFVNYDHDVVVNDVMR